MDADQLASRMPVDLVLHRFKNMVYPSLAWKGLKYSDSHIQNSLIILLSFFLFFFFVLLS